MGVDFWWQQDLLWYDIPKLNYAQSYVQLFCVLLLTPPPGKCDQIDKAFNEAAGRFAILPKAPHMAHVNCDEQPVLCNSWSAVPGNVWAFEMLPPPAAIDISRSRLNLTTTTSDSLVALHTDGKKSFKLIDSWFHPFNGKAAELGVAVPFGYAMWAFGLVPNWAFMILVSFVSRSMM